jgi:sugar/nucleoside kinase (ribokinase family)
LALARLIGGYGSGVADSEIKRPAPGSRSYDALVIGNALVDVLSHADDSFLEENDLPKGHSQLLNAVQTKKLFANLGSTVQVSGGSAANTCVGIASLGGKTSFVGTVADDEFGKLYAHDLQAVGVNYEIDPVDANVETGRSLVVITPDGQRTMSTYLGAAVCIAEDHIKESMIRDSLIVFMEGYLFDLGVGEQIFNRVVDLAKKNGCMVAITLADPFIIQQYREVIERALDSVDLLFVNEAELLELYQGIEFEKAAQAVGERCPYVGLTLSEKGSYAIDHANATKIPAFKTDVIDTTGAGDSYAAGFIYAFTHGEPIERCGLYGAAMATDVISHIGARPSDDVKEIVNKSLRDS